MRKLLGYIPLDPDEDFHQIAKETDVIKIEQQWFKLVEVWVPGTAVIGTDCGNVAKDELILGKWKTEKSDEWKADPLGKLCVHCGKTRDEHVFFTICPKE